MLPYGLCRFGGPTGLRILIVDDHAGFRSIARELLLSAGFQVVGEAADGTSGLEAVRMLRPDLVLLDVTLPDLDGCEVARRLTNGGDGPTVILISTREARDYGGRLENCGARGFLIKTAFSPAALGALLTG